ncbi:hypothetical protein NN561_016574 [Cricetulus griseus]
MVLRRPRASHVARRSRLCSTGRGVGEAPLPPSSSPAEPLRIYWPPRFGGGACPAWPISARNHAASRTRSAPTVWPRLQRIPTLKMSHSGASETIPTVPRNSRSSRADGAGLRSGAGR